MYHTTGFSRVEIVDICGRVEAMFPSGQRVTGRKPALGLFKSIAVTLAYLRRNRVQQELAEYFGTSQSTISRAITTFVPILAAVLADWTPTVDDLDPNTQYIVDGTLLPCWSWQNRLELYSGKHHTTGVNVQVACTLDGDLAWLGVRSTTRIHTRRQSNPGVRIPRPARNRPRTTSPPRRQRLHRSRHDHTNKEATRTTIARRGQTIQQTSQPDPILDRADHRELQDLANPPHRLPTPIQHVRRNNQRHHRTRVSSGARFE